MYKAARIRARPPHTVRLPRSVPLSRLKGATPTKAAICRRSRALEEAVRVTPKEEVGVDLRPRRISLRAKAVLGGLSMSVANVTVVGGSKLVRLRQ